jgi:hypothetical protein
MQNRVHKRIHVLQTVLHHSTRVIMSFMNDQDEECLEILTSSRSAMHSTTMCSGTHVLCPILHYHGHSSSHNLVIFCCNQKLPVIWYPWQNYHAKKKSFREKFTILIKLYKKIQWIMNLPPEWEKHIRNVQLHMIHGVCWLRASASVMTLNLRTMTTLPEEIWAVRFLLLISCLEIRQNFRFVQLWQNTSKNL